MDVAWLPEITSGWAYLSAQIHSHTHNCVYWFYTLFCVSVCARVFLLCVSWRRLPQKTLLPSPHYLLPHSPARSLAQHSLGAPLKRGSCFFVLSLAHWLLLSNSSMTEGWTVAHLIATYTHQSVFLNSKLLRVLQEIKLTAHKKNMKKWLYRDRRTLLFTFEGVIQLFLPLFPPVFHTTPPSSAAHLPRSQQLSPPFFTCLPSTCLQDKHQKLRQSRRFSSFLPSLPTLPPSSSSADSHPSHGHDKDLPKPKGKRPCKMKHTENESGWEEREAGGPEEEENGKVRKKCLYTQKESFTASFMSHRSKLYTPETSSYIRTNVCNPEVGFVLPSTSNVGTWQMLSTVCCYHFYLCTSFPLVREFMQYFI